MDTHHNPTAVIDEKRAEINSAEHDLDTDRATAKPQYGKDQNAVPRRLDEAFWFVQEAGSQKHDQPSRPELKALRTKVDWRIVPIMFLCYTMQFLDKVLLNVSCLPAWSELGPPFSLTALVVCRCHGSEQGSEAQIKRVFKCGHVVLHGLSDSRGAKRYIGPGLSF